MKKLAVIVPCYNEELVIAESYRRTREALHKLPVLTEIIYINDGSRDRTRLMLDEIAASDPQVKVIHFSRNFGHQPAVTAGINNCDADLAVILDADMQDPPELIPSILELQEKEQANVVYCVRKSREGEGLFKKVTAKAFYRMLNYMSDVNFPLDTGDFRLIDRKVMDQFDRFQERGKYIRGLISWVGFKQVPFYCRRNEIPVQQNVEVCHHRYALFLQETVAPGDKLGLYRRIGRHRAGRLVYLRQDIRLQQC